MLVKDIHSYSLAHRVRYHCIGNRPLVPNPSQYLTRIFGNICFLYNG